MHSFFAHLVSVFLFTSTIYAQTIIPTAATSSFPACAISCTYLQQAQTICIPPVAAVTAQIAYDNCFCQSSILQGLYSSPDSLCVSECPTASDRALLQQWFLGFCRQVGQGIDPIAGTATGGQGTTTVVTITSTSNNQPTGATITGSGSGQRASRPEDKSWIEGHWQWILMLAVLLVGFIGLAFLAVWLKKRHRRKTDQKRALASGFPITSEKQKHVSSATLASQDLWGPHQHMHATKGWEYHPQPAMPATAAAATAASARSSKRYSRRSRHSRHPNDPADIEAESSSSHHHSSKGKHKEMNSTDEITPQDSGSKSKHSKNRSRDRNRHRDIENF